MQRYSLKLISVDHDMIRTIKALRSYFNLGLKEAKDIVDAAKNAPPGQRTYFEATPSVSTDPSRPVPSFDQTKREINQVGFAFSVAASEEDEQLSIREASAIQEKVRDAINTAVNNHHFELAKQLMAVYAKHFPETIRG